MSGRSRGQAAPPAQERAERRAADPVDGLPQPPHPAAQPRRPLTARRDAPIGGQAVLEGVMMRGVSTWAVAVRRPSAGGLRKPPPDGTERGPIEVRPFPLVAWSRRRRAYRLPVIRGIVALLESLGIGIRALGISAGAQLPDDGREVTGRTWAVTVAVAVAFAVGLFFVVPVGVASLARGELARSSVLFWALEGLVRTAIFIGYLVALSRVPDLRRVFEYHGAEHKVISCLEAGDELTPERARLYSRLHPRCGTSFLLVVMLVAIVVFAPIGMPAWYVLALTRIIGIPLIAGLSFELIRWAGRNRPRRWVQLIMYPGMQLQRLTTREPDLDQLAVAIAALDAVLAVEEPGAASDLVGVELVA